MNKNEFLRELENLLSDLPEEERREAMEYYVEYFDEAGPDKEDEVLKKLGSPNEVAHNIHEDLAGRELAVISSEGNEKKEEKKTDGWKVACIVLLCILAAPIVIPLVIALVSGVVGLIIGVVSGAIGIFLAACVCSMAFALAAVVLLVVGVAKLFTMPYLGAFLIGLALLLAGLSLLLGFLVVKFLLVALPAICRGIAKLFKKLFAKKEKEEAQA